MNRSIKIAFVLVCMVFACSNTAFANPALDDLIQSCKAKGNSHVLCGHETSNGEGTYYTLTCDQRSKRTVRGRRIWDYKNPCGNKTNKDYVTYDEVHEAHLWSTCYERVNDELHPCPEATDVVDSGPREYFNMGRCWQAFTESVQTGATYNRHAKLECCTGEYADAMLFDYKVFGLNNKTNERIIERKDIVKGITQKGNSPLLTTGVYVHTRNDAGNKGAFGVEGICCEVYQDQY